MNITVNNYTVTLEKTRAQGITWIVRLHKKTFLFNKVVSSDWFLDERQAQSFAQQLADQLKQNSTSEIIKSRKPGWTLTRPA